MPTATHTVVAHAQTPLLPPTTKGKMTLVSPASKAAPNNSSTSHSSNTLAPFAPATPTDPGSSTEASLRGLYSRAARAFLQRDIPLAHSLLDAAFALLGPPAGASPLPALQAQRKKWDILRITLETTVHAAPSPSLPDALREFAALPSAAAVDAMYKRSLALFTPISAVGAGADAAFLPSQILATLAYSSLKLGCADAGRAMIEEWLARRRVDEEGGRRLDDGYAQIIEVYVLQVLPALGEWEYATEFLAYEQELSDAARQRLIDQLSAQRPTSPSPLPTPSPSPPPIAPDSPRSYSPAPSSSSSSSSLSTASTHTVVPRGRNVNGLSAMTPARTRRSSSASSTGTARPGKSGSANGSLRKPNGIAKPNGVLYPTSARRPGTDRSNSDRARSTSSRGQPTSSRDRLALARASLAPPTDATTTNATPRPLEVLRAYLSQYFGSSRTSYSTWTFAVLFVLVPLISFVLRRRRRARIAGAGSAAAGTVAAARTADLVRRRLRDDGSGLLARAWGGVARAVGDTVRMAGSGLV
ncbi:hypothetical protein K523DRAFT_289158 [Schizophyllum commune Tattone D]|nr:hypothetical protein K523DRAFT_289158 [Schizophyllum commune Tattone D]